MLATKNRNIPTRAGLGAPRAVLRNKDRLLKKFVTSKLHTSERLRPRLARRCLDALSDVNAYGARLGARHGHLRQDAARRKLSERARHG
jgi:hypothetical protein